MNIPNSILIAILLGLVVWSPALAAQDDDASIYHADGLGHWVDGETMRGSAVTAHHGPIHGLDPADALLVVGPRQAYDDNEATRFAAFIAAGGRAIVADSTGTGRQLLAGLPVDILGAQVYSTSYERNPAFPIVEGARFAPTVMSKPHVVEGTGEIWLASHPFSWKDLDNDLAPDLLEPIGAWPVAMLVQYGAGSVLVVGDEDVFLQAVSRDTAAAMLDWLADGRVIVVDEGHRAGNDPLRATGLLAGARPGLATALAATGLFVALIAGIRVRIRRIQPKPRRTVRDDPLLDELPDGS